MYKLLSNSTEEVNQVDYVPVLLWNVQAFVVKGRLENETKAMLVSVSMSKFFTEEVYYDYVGVALTDSLKHVL